MKSFRHASDRICFYKTYRGVLFAVNYWETKDAKRASCFCSDAVRNDGEKRTNLRDNLELEMTDLEMDYTRR